MGERIWKIIPNSGYISENIDAAGKGSSGEDMVMDLVIDDGVASRGHWKNIFNANTTYACIGITDHKTYGLCGVFDYYNLM